MWAAVAAVGETVRALPIIGDVKLLVGVGRARPVRRPELERRPPDRASAPPPELTPTAGACRTVPDDTRSFSTPPADAPERAAARAVISDPERLSAVRATGLLDAAEPTFDSLTRLAARLLRAPAAFVSLVDESRDFYVSAVGLDDALGSTRELTGETFCHYTLAGATPEAPLVIPDTAAHPTFGDVPTVRSMGVAAYMGVPLVVGGHPVGALCVVDTVPRDWTPEETEVLGELADSARRELGLRAALAEARRAETARRESEVRRRASEQWLATALAAARMGTFDYDPAADRLALTAESTELFGLEPGTALPTTATALAILHPDDAPRHRATFLEAVRRGTEYESEYRVVRPRDGQVVWIVERGSTVTDPDTGALRVRGVHWDVSERVRAS